MTLKGLEIDDWSVVYQQYRTCLLCFFVFLRFFILCIFWS